MEARRKATEAAPNDYGDKDTKYSTQKQIVYQSFKERPKTMAKNRHVQPLVRQGTDDDLPENVFRIPSDSRTGSYDEKTMLDNVSRKNAQNTFEELFELGVIRSSMKMIQYLLMRFSL